MLGIVDNVFKNCLNSPLTVRSEWLGILTVWFRLLFALSDHNHHFHPLFNTMLFSTSRR